MTAASPVAIVTGASTGIGFEIAKGLLAQGYCVVLNGKSAARLEAALAALGRPEGARAVQGDIGKPETGRGLAAAAVEAFGRLDLLVNNAGIFIPRPFLEADEAYLDGFLETNLKGTIFASQAAIPEMKKGGGGHIINIGSVLVDHAIGGVPASAPIAVKGAIHALGRQLAAEFAKDNIRVNTVAPGIVRTPIFDKLGVKDVDGFANLHLLGRVAEVSDVAKAVLYLTATGFVTGTELYVDGGHAAGHHIA